MGSISSSIVNAQKKMQEEMMVKQKRNMALGQERMRRTMLTYQIAAARDRVWWMGGTYALLVGALGVAASKGKPIPPAAGAPLLIGGAVIAFTADLAYGSKAERIEAQFRSIVDKGNRPFLPLNVDSLIDDYDVDNE